MADDRERNQGMKQGGTGAGAGQQGGQGVAQEAPGRNPQQGQQTGGHQGDAGKQQDGQNRGPQEGQQGGVTKEGGQNEETRR